jgi:inhibitor of KinA sporulation pathway (predicted exonuclease)
MSISDALWLAVLCCAVLRCRYDLEATTNKARTLHPVEIIELSCVIVQAATAIITASYQSFVRPTEHPQLDPFAIELCGIQQHQVDAAPLLSDVLQHHHAWLQQQGVLAEGVTCVPVTWTEWDLKVGPVLTVYCCLHGGVPPARLYLCCCLAPTYAASQGSWHCSR